MTAKTKRGVALRDFNDAGTGTSFRKGDPVDLDEGTWGNYEAAGLVATRAEAEAAKADAPAPSNTGPKA